MVDFMIIMYILINNIVKSIYRLCVKFTCISNHIKHTVIELACLCMCECPDSVVVTCNCNGLIAIPLNLRFFLPSFLPLQ